MMPMSITEAQKQKLMAAAVQEGVDPDALLSAAEELGEGIGDNTQPEAGGPLRFERMLIGLLPYLTVNEARASIGYGPIAGGDAITVEWITRFGGSPPAADE